MTRPCECGHLLHAHHGFFGDCLAAVSLFPDRYCSCTAFVERPSYLARVWRWLREVPV